MWSANQLAENLTETSYMDFNIFINVWNLRGGSAFDLLVDDILGCHMARDSTSSTHSCNHSSFAIFFAHKYTDQYALLLGMAMFVLLGPYVLTRSTGFEC